MHGRWEVMLESAVLLGAVATIPLTILQELGSSSAWVEVGDWMVWGVFFFEYCIGLALSTDRRAYARRNWLNASVVVLSFPSLPAMLELVRMARLARLFRLLRLLGVTTRGLDALGHILGRKGLIYAAAVTAFLVLAGGGYGDIVPATATERLIAIVLMLAGLAFTSVLSASVTAYLVTQDSGTDLEALAQKLDRIEKLLGTASGATPRET